MSITAVQFEVLTVLGEVTKPERTEGVTAAQVAERCGLANPTRAAAGVTGTLNRLVTAGVAARVEAKAAWIITPAGTKALAERKAEARKAAAEKAKADKAAAAAPAAAPATGAKHGTETITLVKA